MGFLGAGNVNTQITKYSGLQVQTTSSCVPVPIVYGANVLAPNCFWYENFKAIAQSASGKGGGKGGTTGYNYACSIMMGICEGPIAGIGQVWQTSSTTTNLIALGLSLFSGASSAGRLVLSRDGLSEPGADLSRASPMSPAPTTISAPRRASATTISRSMAFSTAPASTASTPIPRRSSRISSPIRNMAWASPPPPSTRRRFTRIRATVPTKPIAGPIISPSVRSSTCRRPRRPSSRAG